MGMVGGEENGKDILGRGSTRGSERRSGTVLHRGLNALDGGFGGLGALGVANRCTWIAVKPERGCS